MFAGLFRFPRPRSARLDDLGRRRLSQISTEKTPGAPGQRQRAPDQQENLSSASAAGKHPGLPVRCRHDSRSQVRCQPPEMQLLAHTTGYGLDAAHRAQRRRGARGSLPNARPTEHELAAAAPDGRATSTPGQKSPREWLRARGPDRGHCPVRNDIVRLRVRCNRRSPGTSSKTARE
jgi:hypothetical protein